MLILGFPENLKQAQLLAQAMDCELAAVTIHHFPDGESLVTLPETLADTAVFFRTLHEPNAKLVELYLAIQAARAQGAKRIVLVAPYLCYMRQDKAFRPGQAVSQQIIGELLSGCIDDLITVDPHLHRIASLSQALPHCRSIALSAAPLLGEYLTRNGIKGVLVGPDEESAQWVEQVALASGLDMVVASKERVGDREVRITLPVHSYKGVAAIIVDDVISSGKTVVEAVHQLLSRGATAVGALCTHALFAPGAEEVMAASGIHSVISSNAIPHRTNQVDISPLLARALRDTLSTGPAGN